MCTHRKEQFTHTEFSTFSRFRQPRESGNTWGGTGQFYAHLRTGSNLRKGRGCFLQAWMEEVWMEEVWMEGFPPNSSNAGPNDGVRKELLHELFGTFKVYQESWNFICLWNTTRIQVTALFPASHTLKSLHYFIWERQAGRSQFMISPTNNCRKWPRVPRMCYSESCGVDALLLEFSDCKQCFHQHDL